MTVVYFDTSALVKLFIEEAGSEDVSALWDGADAVTTSRVTEVEVPAALAAARRSRRLDERSHEEAKQGWQRYRGSLRLVEVTPELGETAGMLAETYALGALDALHLASAATVADDRIIMASWDRRLLEAARSLGMATLPALQDAR